MAYMLCSKHVLSIILKHSIACKTTKCTEGENSDVTIAKRGLYLLVHVLEILYPYARNDNFCSKTKLMPSALSPTLRMISNLRIYLSDMYVTLYHFEEAMDDK